MICAMLQIDDRKATDLKRQNLEYTHDLSKSPRNDIYPRTVTPIRRFDKNCSKQ